MAVATPILERTVEETREENRNDFVSRQTADEIHNSRIKQNYAQLINPETKMSDLRPAAAEQAEPIQTAPVQNTTNEVRKEVYLVENARADADIFRADSAINRRVAVLPNKKSFAQQSVSDEENEDSMPTRTTMQYTYAAKKLEEEGKITNKSAENHLNLTKRDKIIVAVVISVIVALFALIIVNSAIISGLDSELNALQTSLDSARESYNSVTGQITDYEANFDETLQTLAESLGMKK